MENKGTKTLETERLILRRFTMEDAPIMYRNWASDDEVTKFLTWPTHKDVSVTEMVLGDWIGRYEQLSFYNWAIELKETGEVIGNISVVKLDERKETADIGYCMSRALWGRGIMPEALRRVIAFLFEEVGLNRIAACHDVNNPKSGRVMDKAGMKLEGIWREAGINNLGRCDEVWHSILRREFMVRFAREEDLERVNEIRKMVNDVHVEGKPEIFKPGFSDELRDHIYDIWNDEYKDIIVAEREGKICGFACIHIVEKPENPFMFERKFYDVDEFGVDEAFRRQGVATEMIKFIREDAARRGLNRIELNMWEFNQGALAFYESVGFKTYRRYMELV